MIEEHAVVVSVEGDKICVEAQVKNTCSSCQAQTNCGTGSVARAFSHKAQQLELKSPMPVKVGQSVVIGIPEKSVVIASWWLYMLPLLFFISTFLILNAFMGNQIHELWVLVVTLLPTYLGFSWVSNKVHKLDKGKFQPILLRRV